MYSCLIGQQVDIRAKVRYCTCTKRLAAKGCEDSGSKAYLMEGLGSKHFKAQGVQPCGVGVGSRLRMLSPPDSADVLHSTSCMVVWVRCTPSLIQGPE